MNLKLRTGNSKLAFAVCALFLTLASNAQAQQAEKIHHIGYLSIGSRSFVPARVEAFRGGLRELGYVEGKNIRIEWRFSDGDATRQRAFAAELARLKVDVIVTEGPADTRAAKEATRTTPIVMAQDTDPVANGFVSSLAHPGGNITGLATLSPELGGKQLELLKEVVPKLSRVAVMGSSNIPGAAQALKATESAAAALGIQLQYVDINSPNDIEGAFKTVSQSRADALIVLGSPVLNTKRVQVAAFATRNRLPATYTRPEFIEAGGLMTYGANYNELYRRAAVYVDKILKGAKPADLPVEQPTKFELVINLKTAKQIGLTIPPNVLARADRVIK
jgi:putative ABC transport system substrate-binding protein